MNLNANPIEALYPLAPSQQGMLFESLAFPASGRHIEQLHWQWQGALRRDAYERAWQQVLARHSSLRTGFLWKDQPEPLQFVLRQVTLPITWHDWRSTSALEQQEQLDAYLTADRQQDFNLTKAPLMRLALLQLAEQQYHAVWTSHHILLDGWCLPILLNEVHDFYEAECDGRTLHLPPARPYRDYIAWLQQQDQAAAEAFWRQRLAGFHTPTPLTTKAGGCAGAPEQATGKRESITVIGPTVLQAMRTLARQNSVTLNTVMQGGWALLLHCYSKATDVVFGVTVSGRPPALANVEAMMGLFISTAPLRVGVEPAMTLAAWLQALQAQTLEQQPYEYCATGQIQQWSEVPVALRLFESLLVFENYPMTKRSPTANKPFTLMDVESIGAQTQYPLTLIVFPHEGLHIKFVYDQAAFAAADIEQLGAHLQTLLETMVAAPQATVATLAAAIPGAQIPPVMPAQAALAPNPATFVPPLNRMERELVKIWQTLFNVPAVSTRSNFYDFGGNSLLAIRLVGQIQQHFGIQLPISALLLNPTIVELAKLIQRSVQQDEQTNALFNSLVPIQPNGSKPPFFLAPGAGGTIFYMYYLARYLDPDQPFYGLQALGLDGQTTPHTTIEAMATHFINMMKQVQPQGPYYLVGHSFGAFIAYEMAQQLLKGGDELAVLINLDTEAPHLIRHLAYATNAEWMQEYVDTFTEVFADKITTSYEPPASDDPEALWESFAAWLRANKMMATTEEVTTARHLLDIFKLQLKMVYKPKEVIPLPMVVLRATGYDVDHRPEKLGWDELQAEVEIDFVPGNHHTFVGEPHIRVTAETLSACLKKAQQAAQQKYQMKQGG